MKAKHTPGPWEMVEHNWSDTSIYAPGRTSTIARISIQDEATEENQSELEALAAADARLIAAAPEMLGALGHVVKLLGMWKEDPECTCEDCVLLRPVYAAITKALGPDWQNSQPTGR